MQSAPDTALLAALEQGDPLRQAIAEWNARITIHKNPKRNAERKARRALRDSGQHPKLPTERKRVIISTALRHEDGTAYTLVGRGFDANLQPIRREWKAGEVVHQIGLGKLEQVAKKDERVRNETKVSKRMRRPIKDVWLNGGMGKLMAIAKIGGAHANALLARVAAEREAKLARAV